MAEVANYFAYTPAYVSWNASIVAQRNGQPWGARLGKYSKANVFSALVFGLFYKRPLQWGLLRYPRGGSCGRRVSLFPLSLDLPQ